VAHTHKESCERHLAKIRNPKSPATVRVKDGTGRRETRLLLRYKYWNGIPHLFVRRVVLGRPPTPVTPSAKAPAVAAIGCLGIAPSPRLGYLMDQQTRHEMWLLALGTIVVEAPFIAIAPL
jgi:hypothetical protein